LTSRHSFVLTLLLFLIKNNTGRRQKLMCTSYNSRIDACRVVKEACMITELWNFNETTNNGAWPRESICNCMFFFFCSRAQFWCRNKVYGTILSFIDTLSKFVHNHDDQNVYKTFACSYLNISHISMNMKIEKNL
jgi:hypothetical protein